MFRILKTDMAVLCTLYFFTKTYIVGTHLKRTNEALPMRLKRSVYIVKRENYQHFGWKKVIGLSAKERK